MSLQHVSLFAGVGGIDLAAHDAGIPTVLACEYDRHARGVLTDRFPSTMLHPDVRELTADDLRAAGAVPGRTVLSAGFPCQDLSVAGARRGLGKGTRSGLYWQVDRLLGEFRPAWVLLENVPGLLSACCACTGDDTCTERHLTDRCGERRQGKWHSNVPHAVTGGACWGQCISRHGGVMGAVLGSLAQRGYGFAYRVLDAQHFGVPQRRRRVVIVGRLGDDGRAPAQVLLEPEGSDGDSAARGAARSGAAPSAARGVVSTLQATGGDRGYRVDAESAAGGHQIPFQRVVRSGARDKDGELPADVWPTRPQAATLSPFDLGSDSRAVELIVQPLALRGRDGGAALEIGPTGGPYNALRAGDGGSSRQSLIAVTLTAGVSRPGVSAPGRRQEDDQNLIAFDPKAGGDRTSSGAFESGTGITPTLGGQRPHAVASTTAVRRLTPLETERLQGWPDNHTASSWGEPQSDSQRYKQAGNGVARPVFTWVLRRLAHIESERAA